MQAGRNVPPTCTADAFSQLLQGENNATTWSLTRAEMLFFSARKAAGCRGRYWRASLNRIASAYRWYGAAAASICRIRLQWWFTKRGVRWGSKKAYNALLHKT